MKPLQATHVHADTRSTPYGCCGQCGENGECGRSGACDLLNTNMVAALLSVRPYTVVHWRGTEIPSVPKPDRSGFFRVDALLAWVQTRGQKYLTARDKTRGWWEAMTREEREKWDAVRGRAVWGERGSPEARTKRHAQSLRASQQHKEHPEWYARATVALMEYTSKPRPQSHRDASSRALKEYYAMPAVKPLVLERARLREERMRAKKKQS